MAHTAFARATVLVAPIRMKGGRWSWSVNTRGLPDGRWYPRRSGMSRGAAVSRAFAEARDLLRSKWAGHSVDVMLADRDEKPHQLGECRYSGRKIVCEKIGAGRKYNVLRRKKKRSR